MTAGELNKLEPHKEVQIDGERVTVRELGFMEGLRLQALIGPVASDLAAGVEVDDVLTIHADAIATLMARAVDRNADWVRTLDDEDGMRLLDAFWEVNRDFFIRRVVKQAAIRILEPRENHQAGEASTPH